MAYEWLPGGFRTADSLTVADFGNWGDLLAGDIDRAKGFSFPMNVNLLSYVQLEINQLNPRGGQTLFAPKGDARPLWKPH
jgi:hypothetical protein